MPDDSVIESADQLAEPDRNDGADADAPEPDEPDDED
jgi:hypothetical protein